MTQITIRSADAFQDIDFLNRRRIKFMINEIAKYDDRTMLLRELESLEKSGVCSAVPPIIGFLTRIGYFSDHEVLLDAICVLKAWEG